MQELMSIGTNIATLIAIGVAVVSGIIVAFAGFQYATAAGDPQKVGLAKSSFIGAFIGLIIASLAFIGPRIVTDMVITPVGGVSLETESGLNCDSILRNQLIFQRGASTDDRMQVVISQIQSRHTECSKDVWNPEVLNMAAANGTSGVIAVGAGKCYKSAGGFDPGTDSTKLKVGEQTLPESLQRKYGPNSDKVAPRSSSGRDSENNIIVYWSDAVANRPSDAASCWLFYARLNSWYENFFQ